MEEKRKKKETKNTPLSVCMQHEDALAQAAFEEARRRTRDFEDRDRSHREDLEVRGPCMLFMLY